MYFKKLLLIATLLICSVSYGQGCISGNCSNGQGTFTFANGSKYVGEFRDRLPHIQGTFTFANGAKYVGEFRDGKPHRQDTFTGTKKDKKKINQVVYLAKCLPQLWLVQLLKM